MKTNYEKVQIPDYFIIIKWLEDGGKCASDLERELEISYKNIHDIKHAFLKLDFIYIEKDHRKQNLYLTDKGKKLLSIANNLFSLFNITKNDIKQTIKKRKIKKEDVDVEELKEEMQEFDLEEGEIEDGVIIS